MLSSSRVYVGGSVNPRALLGARVHNNFVGCLRKVHKNISEAIKQIFFFPLCVLVYIIAYSNKLNIFLSLLSFGSYVLIFIFDFDLGWIFCWHFAIKFDWFSTNWFEIDTSSWSCGLYVSDRWSTRSGYVYNKRFTFGKFIVIVLHYRLLLVCIYKSRPRRVNLDDKINTKSKKIQNKWNHHVPL